MWNEGLENPSGQPLEKSKLAAGLDVIIWININRYIIMIIKNMKKPTNIFEDDDALTKFAKDRNPHLYH